jgi:hypothetical protein
MKKSIIYTAAINLILLYIPLAAHAQSDLIQEGKQVVEKSNLMMIEGQKIKDMKAPDRASLVDQGHMMIKQGIDAMETGEMGYTEKGRANMQEIGAKFRQSGGILLKMGRQKGELTRQEKDSLMKEGDNMIEFGRLMLEKGKFMTNE